jgi:hypothetical protein
LRTATIFNLNNFLQLKSACARLCVALILFFAVGATAQTNSLSDAEIQGRQLAQQLCDERPDTNFTQTGALNIRDVNGQKYKILLQCEVIITAINWQSIYKTIETNNFGWTNGVCLKIIHAAGQPNWYSWSNYNSGGIVSGMGEYKWSGTEWTHPIPGDFLAVDLGLEFFHWPEQKVLPKTANLKRGRDYTLLESTNPNPSTNGYSRVLSWIDKETGGILEAEAYDADGKLLKEFAPKSFKKINGQWELQEMEIRNVQTGSRTRLEFDLQK